MTNKEYIDLISREPTPDMISEAKNKAGEVEYRYIKKSILQRELLNIFQGHTKWDMERDTVTKGGLWGKGVLHYKNPVSGEWLFVSGTASLPHEKKMRLNYPSLESHCMINACKKIGVWFGQTLNISEEDAMPDEDLGDDEQGIEDDAKNVIEKLKEYSNKEDAQEFLSTTTFKHYIPAKTIVNNKPSKLKQNDRNTASGSN